MRLRLRPLWFAAVVAVLSGCALQGPRYDYTGAYAGANEFYPSIIDWNFPTATSQGPIVSPERLLGFRPAIGVPWASGDPLPWRNPMAPALDGAPRAEAAHDGDTSCTQDSQTAPITRENGARADARVGEPVESL